MSHRYDVSEQNKRRSKEKQNRTTTPYNYQSKIKKKTELKLLSYLSPLKGEKVKREKNCFHKTRIKKEREAELLEERRNTRKVERTRFRLTEKVRECCVFVKRYLCRHQRAILRGFLYSDLVCLCFEI